MPRKRNRRAPGEGAIYERPERGTWMAAIVPGQARATTRASMAFRRSGVRIPQLHRRCESRCDSRHK